MLSALEIIAHFDPLMWVIAWPSATRAGPPQVCGPCGARTPRRGTRLPAGSQKRQRSKSILHFTCLPLALTLTAAAGSQARCGRPFAHFSAPKRAVTKR